MNAINERKAFLVLMGSLITLAWITLWAWEQSPYGRYLDHSALGDLDPFAGTGSLAVPAFLYIAGWTLMTVAMMLPTTLPLLEMFRRMTAQRADRTRLVTLLVVGYLVAWGGFGVLAHGGDWVVHEITEHSVWLEANAWVIGAGTLVIAGAFQFSRLKYRCLDKCRAPLTFIMEYWSGGHDSKNAFMLGVQHGIFCVGCCWALMLLMFGVGIGNVGWMLVLGAIMAIEKNMSWGKKISAPLGIGLLLWGGVIFAYQI